MTVQEIHLLQIKAVRTITNQDYIAHTTTVQKTKHIKGNRHVSVFLIEILLQIEQMPKFCLAKCL